MKTYYNPETHQYFIDDIEVPSVTQLLPKQDFYCSEEHLENCRIEGDENHSLIKMYNDTKKTFDLPYLIAFDKFMIENQKKFGELLYYEKPLFFKNNSYQFGGTPDMVFNNIILDVKRRPGNSKYHALQFSGYDILANKNDGAGPKGWFICWYDEEKNEFKKRNVYNDKAEAAFMALLRNYYNNKFIEQYFKSDRR